MARIGRQKSEQVVYFVSDGTACKIGITSAHTLSQRMTNLQTGNPRSVEVLATLPGGRRLELEIHQRLDPYRIRGEWFELRAALEYLVKEGLLS